MNRRITSTLIVSAVIASSTLAGCASKADPSAMRAECSKIADILGVVLEDLTTINDGLGRLDVSQFTERRNNLQDQQKKLSALDITDGILANDVKNMSGALQVVIDDLGRIAKDGPAAISSTASDIDKLTATAERVTGSCL